MPDSAVPAREAGTALCVFEGYWGVALATTRNWSLARSITT
ncbi:hypothetical protein [Streptomyces sp. NWU339]|nr:hypothetical protein [Streptomyces sp. NWU339]